MTGPGRPAPAPAVGRLAFACGLLCLAGCATVYNPTTARRERTLYGTADEVRLGRRVSEQIGRELELSGDQAQDEWVNRVGAAVAGVSGRADIDFSFGVIDEDRVNAFAVPGGFVYVTTGMLGRIETDDELACVLGHEVAHIAARHSIKRLESRRVMALPAMAVNLLTAFQYNFLIGLAYGIGELHYSRRDELEADELGMLYARRAGYDPAGAVSLFEKLRVLEDDYPWLLMKPLSTHPPMADRIDNARRWLAIMERTDAYRQSPAGAGPPGG